MNKPAITQTLTVWRAEVAAEHNEARKPLPAMEAELLAASAAHEAASANASDLRQTLDTFRIFAPAISARLSFVQAAADDARRARDKARVTLAQAKVRITELQVALRQLDTLLAADDVEVAA
jgi:chromosome segregation ATPase